ncbi:MAG: hypothetical protein HQK52_18245 [Oligoflexia bacterium]|nr:hypothetical protein [Oligoflexia bacterium]
MSYSAYSIRFVFLLFCSCFSTVQKLEAAFFDYSELTKAVSNLLYYEEDHCEEEGQKKFQSLFNQSGTYTHIIDRKSPVNNEETLEYQIEKDFVPFSLSYNPIVAQNNITREYPLYSMVKTDQIRHSLEIYDKNDLIYSSEKQDSDASRLVAEHFTLVHTLLKENIRSMIKQGAIKKSAIDEDLVVQTILKSFASRTQTFDFDVLAAINDVVATDYKDKIIPHAISQKEVYKIIKDQLFVETLAEYELSIADETSEDNIVRLGTIKSKRAMVFNPILGWFSPEEISLQLP